VLIYQFIFHPSAYIPVYIPAYKDANDNMTAKLGDNTWSGISGSQLTKDSGSMGNDFNISNQDNYPVKKLNLQDGQFGYAISNSQGSKNYYWKGNDGKVRVINPSQMDTIKNDPTLTSQINRAVPLSDNNIKDLGTLQSFPASKMASFYHPQNQTISNPQSDNKSLFSRLLTPNVENNPLLNSPVNNLIGGVVSKFFSNRKNRQSVPQKPVVTSGGNTSTKNLIQSGQKFFRKSQ